MEQDQRNKKIGAKVKQLRKDFGWSQTELGQRVGLEKGTISNIENGTQGITRVADKLAQALGTTTDYLYGLSDNPLPPEDEPTPPDPLRDVILSEFDQLDEAERRALVEIAVTLRLMKQRRGSRVIE